MTTIAWDGKSVAADGQVTYGGQYIGPKSVRKIKRIDDIVYALAGSAPLFDPFVEWYRNGANPQNTLCVEKNDETALFVFKDGKCLMYKANIPYPDELFPPDAWGAGCEYAIGAMLAGADAKRAVEIAAICNPGTGGEICVEEL